MNPAFYETQSAFKFRWVNPIAWLLEHLFPVQPIQLKSQDLHDSLSYINRLNRDGVEPVLDHTRVWNFIKSPDGIGRWEAADLQPFISGARLDTYTDTNGQVHICVTEGEAKPVYTPGTRESRTAIRMGASNEWNA